MLLSAFCTKGSIYFIIEFNQFYLCCVQVFLRTYSLPKVFGLSSWNCMAQVGIMNCKIYPEDNANRTGVISRLTMTSKWWSHGTSIEPSDVQITSMICDIHSITVNYIKLGPPPEWNIIFQLLKTCEMCGMTIITTV